MWEPLKYQQGRAGGKPQSETCFPAILRYPDDMCTRVTLCICLLLGSAMGASALGPHEMLLLINTNSARSVELANHYIALRKIPAQNVIEVGVPSAAIEGAAQISREDYTRSIWEPLQAALRERRLEDHILAVAFSADFPVSVTTDPVVSVQGLTLVRNQLPPAAAISNGQYASRLFAGPGRDLQKRGAPRTLENFAMILGTNMPMPSMSLAHTGLRGETLDQAIARLESSARPQGSPPPGQVFFLTSEDVRTTCRSWQFEDVVKELKGIGQAAQIVPLAKANRAEQAWGIMAGVYLLDPAKLPQLVPGSIGEHLTSFVALFTDGVQTKSTAWLLAGAAGTAGTVTEPLSNWTKFPTGRIFVHYASGCTLLESFAQSVLCPMQLAIIGDPLLAPWSKPQGITLVSLAEETGPVSGTVEFAASTWAGLNDRNSSIMYLLDGRSVMPSGAPPMVHINTRLLADGYHELRAIVYSSGLVRQQGFTTLGFMVNNRGYSLKLTGLSENERLAWEDARPIHLDVHPAPESVALVQHESFLASQPWTETSTYTLRPSLLGPGPATIQLAALYKSGEVVKSAPLRITIARPGEATLAP